MLRESCGSTRDCSPGQSGVPWEHIEGGLTQTLGTRRAPWRRWGWCRSLQDKSGAGCVKRGVGRRREGHAGEIIEDFVGQRKELRRYPLGWGSHRGFQAGGDRMT